MSNKIDLSRVIFKENNKIIKILYVDYNSITIYGLLLKLKDISIKYEDNNYNVFIKPESILYKIDNYLNNNINNYSNIIKDNKFIINKKDKNINKYYEDNATELFINIKYIFKNKTNNPIINII